MEKFVERLKQANQTPDGTLRMSWAELARRAGVSKQTVSNILNYRHTPSASLGISLYEALGLSADEALMDMGLKKENADVRQSAFVRSIAKEVEEIKDEDLQNAIRDFVQNIKRLSKKNVRRHVKEGITP